MVRPIHRSACPLTARPPARTHPSAQIGLWVRSPLGGRSPVEDHPGHAHRADHVALSPRVAADHSLFRRLVQRRLARGTAALHAVLGAHLAFLIRGCSYPSYVQIDRCVTIDSGVQVNGSLLALLRREDVTRESTLNCRRRTGWCRSSSMGRSPCLSRCRPAALRCLRPILALCGRCRW